MTCGPGFSSTSFGDGFTSSDGSLTPLRVIYHVDPLRTDRNDWQLVVSVDDLCL